MEPVRRRSLDVTPYSQNRRKAADLALVQDLHTRFSSAHPDLEDAGTSWACSRRPQTVTARDAHLLPFPADQQVHALSHSRFESNAKYISDTCFPPDRAHFLETAFNSSFVNTRSSIAAVHHLAPNTHQTSRARCEAAQPA